VQLYLALSHNHNANTIEFAVVKTKVDKKHLAANIRERPAKLAENPAAARQLTGEEDTTKKIIRRVRKGQAPPVPVSLSALTIEGEWAQTSGPFSDIFV